MAKRFVISMIIVFFAIALNGCSGDFSVDQLSKSARSLWNEACVRIGLCETKTDNLKKYVDSLGRIIEGFEKKRARAADNITKSATGDAKSGVTYDPDLAGVSRRWEYDWENIREVVQELVTDFNNVGGGAKAYFFQLETLAEEIKNAELKQSEIERNQILKTTWDEVHDQAQQNIRKLEDLIAEGDDFLNVLIGTARRGDIKKNHEVLKELSQRATAIVELVNELEALTQEGRNLVQSAS